MWQVSCLSRTPISQLPIYHAILFQGEIFPRQGCDQNTRCEPERRRSLAARLPQTRQVTFAAEMFLTRSVAREFVGTVSLILNIAVNMPIRISFKHLSLAKNSIKNLICRSWLMGIVGAILAAAFVIGLLHHLFIYVCTNSHLSDDHLACKSSRP